MADQAVPTPAAEAMPIFTPINLILFSLAAYLVFNRLKPTTTPIPIAPTPVVYQSYTPRTLKPFNGTDNPRILMAVKGIVFDVTAGGMFYGPGGPYNIFAGRDASRGLAKGALEEGLLTDVGKPIDDLGDLTRDEKDTLQGWVDQFSGKYLVVGDLVNEGEEEK